MPLAPRRCPHASRPGDARMLRALAIHGFIKGQTIFYQTLPLDQDLPLRALMVGGLTFRAPLGSLQISKLQILLGPSRCPDLLIFLLLSDGPDPWVFQFTVGFSYLELSDLGYTSLGVEKFIEVDAFIAFH
ncbi:hypothetical protein VNO80_25254 [Phaseolus coccineus]|uniref:Uncharacterized protein n=1 Tax=Phaseolus coccineus TaxID=3886 RepID=A0AAN9LYU1_PHACN